jgi:hypothetical protein
MSRWASQALAFLTPRNASMAAPAAHITQVVGSCPAVTLSAFKPAVNCSMLVPSAVPLQRPKPLAEKSGLVNSETSVSGAAAEMAGQGVAPASRSNGHPGSDVPDPVKLPVPSGRNGPFASPLTVALAARQFAMIQ